MERAELIKLLRATGCAEEHGGFTFLCDPNWSAAERAKVAALQKSKIGNQKSEIGSGWLCVPTGGSGGGVRFARHDERTLTAAVEGFCAHFGIERVNALGVLPPHHVSGLMARVRCAATGGEHLAGDWKSIAAGQRPALRDGNWVLSLVPTQLQRLLVSPEAVAWLRGFRVIFIGGGPVWPELADAAARAELPVALSYGLTETAAMVAALRPAEFLAGDRGCGAALPHARVVIDGEGVITITGESVFRGYFPEESAAREFTTEDLGHLDERGHLHVLGRRDAVIITGGKKVQPAEVEAALRASGEFADVAVVGMPDPEWGHTVVACYPANGPQPDLKRLPAALAGLAAFKRPKRYVAIASWPRNAQGKLNRAALLAAGARR
jgi:O-succinylbenzoic acid--CoA ligase